MNFGIFFKKGIRKRVLKEVRSERDVSFYSFSMAKRVSFSFSYDEEGIEQTIADFVSFLIQNNITFSGVGTVLLKTKKQIIHLDENISVIYKNDCNYYGVPDSYKTAKLFVNEFDIFVDFNNTANFTQTFLALKTNAKFKIGRISKDSSPYDLVVEPNEEDKSSSAFLKQLFHYLNIIKPA